MTLKTDPFRTVHPSMMVSSKRIRSWSWRLVSGLALLSVGSLSASAQVAHSVTDGFTPPVAAPGSPAGSYALSGFDTVNMFSGHLNFRLPLLRIGGRGEASYTMTLAIEPVRWRVIAHDYPYSTLDYVTPSWWAGDQVGYGPGFLEGRFAQRIDACINGTNGYVASSTISRMTFTAADGTEYELHDTQNQGIPFKNPGQSDGTCSINIGKNRGTEFVSTDGSGLTFVSSSIIDDSLLITPGDITSNFTPSGSLYFRDGTMYQIKAGVVESIRDRNGNRIRLVHEHEDTLGTQGDTNTHALIQVIDPIGRVVNITYGTGPGSCDRITFDGSDGQQSRTIQVCYAAMGDPNVLRNDFTTTQSPKQLFAADTSPVLTLTDTTPINYTVVSHVTLPNNKQYTLQYNPYADIARALLPTGGAYEYDYASGEPSSPHDGIVGQLPNVMIYRRVTQRRVYRENGTRDSTTVFSIPGTGAVVQASHYDGSVDPTQTANATPLAMEKHTYSANAQYGFLYSAGPLDYGHSGLEIQTDEMASASQTPIRTVVQSWGSQIPTPFPATGYLTSPPDYNPRLKQTVTTIDGISSSQIYCYDDSTAFNNKSDVYEYDYGFSGPSGVYCAAPSNYGSVPSGYVRRTHTDYKTDSAYLANSVHLWSLPIRQQILNASSTVSDTKYTYDEGTPTGYSDIASHEFTNSGGINQAIFGTSYTTRGDVTTVSRWAHSASVTTDRWINTTATYDIAGNVLTVTDGNGNQTALSFVDSFSNSSTTLPSGQKSYGFPTTVIDPFSNANTLSYDYYIGKATSMRDPNHALTTFDYTADPLDRLKRVTYPVGTIQYSYDDTPNKPIVTTTKSINSCGQGNSLVNEAIFDGLGREKIASVQTGSSNWISTVQTYDALGRVSAVSNPYSTGPSPDSTSATAWRYTSYDAINRVKQIKDTDSAVTDIQYSGQAGTPQDPVSADQAEVTDPSGIVRRNLTDALGRLERVTESPNGTKAVTSYTYDALDDLLGVTQSTTGQSSVSRSFQYDSLKRLTSTTNPESGLTCYGVLDNSQNCIPTTDLSQTAPLSYDGNGNLLKRTDARKTVTTYAYDALNRITSKSYGGGSAPPTPTVTYCYDGQIVDLSTGQCTPSPASIPNAKTRLTQVSSSASTNTFLSYDALGRITASSQNTPTGTSHPTYHFTYTYNDAGGSENITYDSGRSVKSCYDQANRLSSVTGTKAGTPTSYASSMSYADHGALASVNLGNGLWEHTNFNTRLQALSIGLGTTATDSSVLGLQYTYVSPNNGNVQSQTMTFPGFSATQNYGYDPMNRLKTAVEADRDQTNKGWSQTYVFDSAGNRALLSGTAYYIPGGPYTPQVGADDPAQVSTLFPNNRWNGASHGDSGNVIAVVAQAFSYDAENRIVGAAIPNIDSIGYAYDGDGRRVSKTVKRATTTFVTTFVYDAMGQLAAEYGPATDAGTEYLTGDALGSTRVVTDGSAVVKRRYDYLPFGEEIPLGINGRPAPYQAGGYPSETPDVVGQKFTGKERDWETGLDYFLTRYFSSPQGRFTSPDEPFADQHTSDPQSWNLYAYARNNPLRFTDPNGRAVQVCLDDENGKTKCTFMSDPEYAKAYQNNPGVVAPAAGANAGPGGGLAVGGAITCGGAVCGSATYQEESMQEDSFANGLFLGIGRALLSLGESAVSGIAGSIRNVNPTGGTMNCVNCAIATDATLAGRPASALPGGATSIGVLEQQFGGQFAKVASKEAIDQTMQAAGPGARAIVYGERAGGVGHVFNVVNQGGVVRYLDGQTGQPASFAGYTGFRVLKTN